MDIASRFANRSPDVQLEVAHLYGIAERLVGAWQQRTAHSIQRGRWSTYSTDGWAIEDGEDVLVCRAPWSERAIVSGKRLRSWWRAGFQLGLEAALTDAGVPCDRVSMPLSAYSTTAEELIERWKGLQQDVPARYADAANGVADAWLRHGWFRVELPLGRAYLERGTVWAGVEYLAVTIDRPRVVVLSAKRYPSGGHSALLRDALRVAFTTQRVPYLALRPVRLSGSTYTQPQDLREAWRVNGLRPA